VPNERAPCHSCNPPAVDYPSEMEMEITLPSEVPVMTLPNVAFFPQALMPLHIFEPRYRRMLADTLKSNRLFAVAGIDPSRSQEIAIEPPHRVASVGIVRACQENADGTSDLLLQGLCRVEIQSIIREEPYRRIAVRPLTSELGATPEKNISLRKDLARLVAQRQKYDQGGPKELVEFLKTVDDPEAFVDIAAFTLCRSPCLKQRLLEELNVNQRLRLFRDEVRREIDHLGLSRQVQGILPDDRIGLN
jgi:Lon protease-like protein